MAILTAVGMLIVLLMGARVTATGSGEGCGNDWPLCHGSWLPADTYESLTEYSHRFVTSIEGLFVLATTILAWPLRKRHPEFKVLVPVVGGTLLLQSLMGAAAVKWPTSPEVMATHFGISLICLASAALVAFILMEKKEPAANRAALTESQGRSLRVFRSLVIVTFVFSIVVAYSGAYVRHTESELACSTWPTCDGSAIPDIDGTPAGIQSTHRVLAAAISVMIVAIAVMALRLRSFRPDLMSIGITSVALVIAQGLVGAWVVYSGLALMATLSHAGLMALLFVILAEGIRRTWPRSASPYASIDTVRPSSPQVVTGD
ncbi:MAG: COX15/CtaA family protein [Chloroflexota bacterium]|nr:COX15/CtaA family protein [Chloroflexota bacterium]